MKRRRDRFRVAGDAQLALAWYTRETWARLREVADDAQALDGTFEEWERGALAAIRDLESAASVSAKCRSTLTPLSAGVGSGTAESTALRAPSTSRT
jgi:hypothetical protein